MAQRSGIGGIIGGGEDVSTFLGLPDYKPGDKVGAAVIGAPCATPYEGVEPYATGAPAAIRAAAANDAPALHHMDFDLGAALIPPGCAAADCGDIPHNLDDAPGNRAAIRAAIANLLSAGAVPVVLGGDDSIPIPVIEAYADHGPVTLIQIDAHIDWRDEVRGERLGLSSTMRRSSEMAHVERIIQIGARAVGSARPSDADDARAWGAQLITAVEFHSRSVADVLKDLPQGANVVVDFDLDALDPSVAPAVIGPAPGGLSMADAIALLLGIGARNRLAGFCLVEFAEKMDANGVSALAAYRLCAIALGLALRND